MACTMGSVDVEKSTNVNETTTQNNFTLYSNPFTNDCKIKGTEANGTIIICNEEGRELLQQQTLTDETMVNISMLIPGFYILKYYKSSTSKTFKLVKLND